jgi:quercetin dioxygenase-like cupin family protein
MNYPAIISKLPKIDIVADEVNGYLLQGKDNQLVFFEFNKDTTIPRHSHGAQWGIVVDGEIRLTISGVEKTYRKGDSYYVPAGAEHSGVTFAGFKAIDFFDQADRYKSFKNNNIQAPKYK